MKEILIVFGIIPSIIGLILTTYACIKVGSDSDTKGEDDDGLQ